MCPLQGNWIIFAVTLLKVWQQFALYWAFNVWWCIYVFCVTCPIMYIFLKIGDVYTFSFWITVAFWFNDSTLPPIFLKIKEIITFFESVCITRFSSKTIDINFGSWFFCRRITLVSKIEKCQSRRFESLTNFFGSN